MGKLGKPPGGGIGRFAPWGMLGRGGGKPPVGGVPVALGKGGKGRPWAPGGGSMPGAPGAPGGGIPKGGGGMPGNPKGGGNAPGAIMLGACWPSAA